MQDKAMLQKADALLERIGVLADTIGMIENEAAAIIDKITKEYKEKLMPLKAEILTKDKTLLKLMRKSSAAIFAGADKVQILHGILFRSEKDKVTIPRNALALAIKLGLSDAYNVTNTLNRENIEKWPDDQLLLIGATRKPTEEYSYETSKDHPADQ